MGPLSDSELAQWIKECRDHASPDRPLEEAFLALARRRDRELTLWEKAWTRAHPGRRGKIDAVLIADEIAHHSQEEVTP